MEPKDRVFFLKLFSSAVVGAVVGAVNALPEEGILAFLLVNFISGSIMLLSSREARQLGPYKVYRDFLVTTFLVYVLVWTLAMNSIWGWPVILACPREPGPHPLYRVEVSSPLGPVEITPIPPGESISGYNAVYVVQSEDSREVFLGAYGPASSGVSLGDVSAELTSDGIVVSAVFLVTPGINELDWGNVTLGVSKAYVESEWLVGEVLLGGSTSFSCGSLPARMSLEPSEEGAVLTISIGPSAGESLNLSGTPLSSKASLVILSGGDLYLFEASKRTGVRTIRVDEFTYLVIGG